MNTDEQFQDEQHAFDELLGADRFDDSVCDDHQRELRLKALQAFDQSNREAKLIEPATPSSERRRTNLNLILGYVAIIAVCLIGIVTLVLYRGNVGTERPVVEPAYVTLDSQLVAALAEVGAYREEVSSDALFNAIAMCQRDFEGRISRDLNQP